MIGWGNTYFTEPASNEAYRLNVVYEHTMVVAVIVMIVVVWFMGSSLRGGKAGVYCNKYLDNPQLEFWWSIFPLVLLIPIFVLSSWTLYAAEAVRSNIFAEIKVIGHQWYWEYQYGNMWSTGKVDAVESRALPYMDNPFAHDLYNADQRMVLAAFKTTRMLFTSEDVIHSWSVSALGVKVDCIPGRINRCNVTPSMMGVFYGQCSELCGSHHFMMPISVEVVTPLKYYEYVMHLLYGVRHTTSVPSVVNVSYWSVLKEKLWEVVSWIKSFFLLPSPCDSSGDSSVCSFMDYCDSFSQTTMVVASCTQTEGAEANACVQAGEMVDAKTQTRGHIRFSSGSQTEEDLKAMLPSVVSSAVQSDEADYSAMVQTDLSIPEYPSVSVQTDMSILESGPSVSVQTDLVTPSVSSVCPSVGVQAGVSLGAWTMAQMMVAWNSESTQTDSSDMRGDVNNGSGTSQASSKSSVVSATSGASGSSSRETMSTDDLSASVYGYGIYGNVKAMVDLGMFHWGDEKVVKAPVSATAKCVPAELDEVVRVYPSDITFVGPQVGHSDMFEVDMSDFILDLGDSMGVDPESIVYPESVGSDSGSDTVDNCCQADLGDAKVSNLAEGVSEGTQVELFVSDTADNCCQADLGDAKVSNLAEGVSEGTQVELFVSDTVDNCCQADLGDAKVSNLAEGVSEGTQVDSSGSVDEETQVESVPSLVESECQAELGGDSLSDLAEGSVATGGPSDSHFSSKAQEEVKEELELIGKYISHEKVALFEVMPDWITYPDENYSDSTKFYRESKYLSMEIDHSKVSDSLAMAEGGLPDKQGD